MTSHSDNFDWLPALRKQRVKKPKPVPMPAYCYQRYQQAHELHFNRVAKDAGHYFKPNMPDCNKSNGLTLAIVNFLIWNGHRATRVSSAGRMIKGKFIPGPTRKGAADISSTINGRSVMFEIKIGADVSSEYQLREQELEEKAGGKYFFVKTFEQFLENYDTIHHTPY